MKNWDFNGARTILEDWQQYVNQINSLISENNTDKIDTDINDRKIKNIITLIDVTIGYFNLDSSGTSRYKKNNRSKSDEIQLFLDKINQNYDKLLNLYTQCRIFWEIDQVANFLGRMSTFCEEVLHYLILYV